MINSYSLAEGGAERLVRRLHIGLRERHIDSNLFGLLALQDVDAMPFASSLNLRSPYGWKAFRGTHRYVVKEVKDGDIVHAHLFPTILYLSILKKLGILKTELVYTEHSTSNRRRGKWYGKIIDYIVYAGCDRVVAISHGAKAEILSWMPELTAKTTVVQNGVQLRFLQPIHREKKERPIVLSVGRICDAKNYPVVLKAMALLKDLDFEYHIAGAGSDMDALKQTSFNYGLASRVHFLGYVGDVRDNLCHADVFLIASRWEGFGLAAVEAMNASLPVIASDIPGLREVVRQEPACAILVDPESPGAIADALRDLLSIYYVLWVLYHYYTCKIAYDKLPKSHRLTI
ncbi:MAG: glycosyltransferase family 4 protein, partial [Mariprofundaceae bacterium]